MNNNTKAETKREEELVKPEDEIKKETPSDEIHREKSEHDKQDL